MFKYFVFLLAFCFDTTFGAQGWMWFDEFPWVYSNKDKNWLYITPDIEISTYDGNSWLKQDSSYISTLGWVWVNRYPFVFSHKEDGWLHCAPKNSSTLYAFGIWNNEWIEFESYKHDFNLKNLSYQNPPESLSISMGSDSAMSLELIWVNPGNFTMGSPTTEQGREINEDQFEVTLNQGYYLGKFEVTQDQYASVFPTDHWYYDEDKRWPSYFSGSRKPVDSISKKNIRDFLFFFNENYREILPKGWEFCLPTEAQWEYACRAGSPRKYSWGDKIDSSNCHYLHDSSNLHYNTKNVGSYPPNLWGFYDIHGNVSEFVDDFYDNYPTGHATDPFGPIFALTLWDGDYVIRGGNFVSNAEKIRSAKRSTTRSGSNAYGFRVSLQYFEEEGIPWDRKFKSWFANPEPYGGEETLIRIKEAKDNQSKELSVWRSANISDISPLAGLDNLETLSLVGHDITDIEPISRLANLVDLDLSWNYITDLNPLKGLIQLESLKLSSNRISSIESLKGLTKLQGLFLDENRISDISPIVSLSNLTGLELSQNSINYISPISKLKKIEVLGLNGNLINDISPVTSNKNLNYLEFNDNDVSDISALSSLTSITHLYFDNNSVTDVSPLRNSSQLISLWFRSNDVSDIMVLKNLKNLLDLGIEGNPYDAIDRDQLDDVLKAWLH